jgi:DNA-binding MarR family transcriptional regulator
MNGTIGETRVMSEQDARGDVRAASGTKAKSAEADAVLAAARVLVDVVLTSIADVKLTLPQFRLLLIVSARGPLNLSAVAEDLGVHPSNATRASDRMIEAGLLDRREAEGDRRHVALSLTSEGERVVASVMRRRRRAVTQVLDRMPKGQRKALIPALEAFTEAAVNLPPAGAHGIG